MLRAILIVVLVATAVVVALWTFQRRLIYLPSRSVPAVPDDVEEVRYETSDGLELAAWFVAGSGERDGTLIVFNGNAGNRSDRVSLARALAGSGYSTLLVDYRGYGDNPGSPSEIGLASDARAALAYAESRADVDPNRIAYFGESLGSGVAVGLASERAPAALVLRSPFTSLAGVAAVHYPFLPVSLLLKDRYENEERIGEVDAPLLVIAGSEDRIVPTELSRDLFTAAAEPKELVIVDGADHNDRALLAGPEMIDALVAFLDEAMVDGSAG